ncbi:hypothetical protein QWI17_16000 [Gilvimarinus sp. SDUM040013]|uniref:Uncharacterized protein n=1 Tax=Gilvimarinus gilvus TaxID=3058038 RepID=A0ABU4RZI9_9GAMM|nr:hypothetical protein [Gilvimarinus sp. SDUM040013]MDO3387344.1 hypothetical protein [Gilvimarinus sp. SDUM040013]MDX6849033.1 hypothetical protein [Gilvimarinus sp. SDUM040013]
MPGRLFLATPARWVQRPNGSFQCLRETTDSEEAAPLAMVLYRGLLSTFGTLRSVAEPKEAQWLNSVALTHAVVSRLGHPLDKAGHKTHAAHCQRVTGTALPTLKPFVAREKSRSLADEAKLCWATESESFSESKTSTAPLALLNGNPQMLRLPIAAPEQVITKLRFDVANRPGCFEVESITVLQANGEVLWHWNHTREWFPSVKGATLVVDQATGLYCILSRGNAPQLLLALPTAILKTAPGGILQIQLSAWPRRL